MLELAFAGSYGMKFNLNSKCTSIFEVLFAKEFGFVLEVNSGNINIIAKKFNVAVVRYLEIS